MSIEGQCHVFTIYFQVLYVLCITSPRYQVSVYRTIGPLVLRLFCDCLESMLSNFVKQNKKVIMIIMIII